MELKRMGWAWLFLIPFAALLFPGLYAHQSPALGGLPFMYWYLLLWVVLTGILSAVVLTLTRSGEEKDE